MASPHSKRLRVLSGRHAGACLELEPGEHTIGAAHENDIAISDWTAPTQVLHVDAQGAVQVHASGANHAPANAQSSMPDTAPAMKPSATLPLWIVVAKPMMAAKSGVIINIGSMIAYGGPPHLGIYGSSKAALLALTKHAASSFGRGGVRAFCVNLGWANTEGEHNLQTTFYNSLDNWHETIGKRMPAGRLILPDDIADLCAYLISPSAQMMNGAGIDFEQVPAGVFYAHPALGPE